MHCMFIAVNPLRQYQPSKSFRDNDVWNQKKPRQIHYLKSAKQSICGSWRSIRTPGTNTKCSRWNRLDLSFKRRQRLNRHQTTFVLSESFITPKSSSTFSLHVVLHNHIMQNNACIFHIFCIQWLHKYAMQDSKSAFHVFSQSFVSLSEKALHWYCWISQSW